MRSIFAREFVLDEENLYVCFRPYTIRKAENQGFWRIAGNFTTRKWDRVIKKGILLLHTWTNTAELIWNNNGELEVIGDKELVLLAKAIIKYHERYLLIGTHTKREYFKQRDVIKKLEESPNFIRRTVGARDYRCKWVETSSGMVVVEALYTGLSTLVFASMDQFMALTHGGRFIGNKVVDNPDVLKYWHVKGTGEIHPDVQQIVMEDEP